MYTLTDIAKETGLKKRFLRETINKAPEFKKKFSKRGPNNSLLFDSNGFHVFVEVARRKEAGETSTQIADFMEAQDFVKPSQPEKTEGKPKENDNPYNLIETLVNKQEELFNTVNALNEEHRKTLRELLEEKEKRLKAESEIKLLTDGSGDITAYKKQQEQKSERLGRLEQELESHRAKASELEKLKADAQKQKEEEEKHSEALKKQLQIQNEIKQLWEKHSKLGFFQGKLKREIQAEIQALEEQLSSSDEEETGV